MRIWGFPRQKMTSGHSLVQARRARPASRDFLRIYRPHVHSSAAQPPMQEAPWPDSRRAHAHLTERATPPRPRGGVMTMSLWCQSRGGCARPASPPPARAVAVAPGQRKRGLRRRGGEYSRQRRVGAARVLQHGVVARRAVVWAHRRTCMGAWAADHGVVL